MRVGCIGATNEIGHVCRRMIVENGNIQPDGACVAGLTDCGAAHAFCVRHRQGRRHTGNLLRLDGVQFMVAPQGQRNRLCGAFDNQRFQCLLWPDFEHFAQRLDGPGARRRHLGERLCRYRSFAVWRDGRGHFEV